MAKDATVPVNPRRGNSPTLRFPWELAFASDRHDVKCVTVLQIVPQKLVFTGKSRLDWAPGPRRGIPKFGWITPN